MPMLLNKHRFALLVALATVSLPIAAQAQRRSPLADAPAIRKRFELRQTRFEVGVGGGTTVNQDFYHTVSVNVRLAFHITDWLAIAGFGNFGVAQVSTGFYGKLNESLMDPRPPAVPREPTAEQATASLQQISSIMGGQLEFTPFTGKWSMFGKLFSAYDFYGFVGPAAITVKTAGSVPRTCDQTPPPLNENDPLATDRSRYYCEVSGLKVGPTFGVGLHTFFGQGVALNVELRDTMAQLNPSGRDVNGDGMADANDLTWTHTFMVGGNLVVFLPFSPKVSP
jgi:outer membrane beta-barrel protein